MDTYRRRAMVGKPMDTEGTGGNRRAMDSADFKDGGGEGEKLLTTDGHEWT